MNQRVQPTSKRPWAIWIAAGAVTLLLLLLGGYNVARAIIIKRIFAHRQMPPAVVSAETARTELWADTLSAVGSTKAVNGIEVTSEVAGHVLKIPMVPGQMVHKGQPLFVLNDAQDQALLKSSLAQMKLDKLTYDRTMRLFKRHALSKQQRDEALSSYQQSQAMVEKMHVMVAQKHINAPFAGRVGIRQVSLGSYVAPGQALVSLQSVDPMWVDFDVPGYYLPKLHQGLDLQVSLEAYPDKIFSGKLIALDAMVDPGSRMVHLQGQLNNKDRALIPGSLAKITVVLAAKHAVTTVLQTAVTYSLYGDTVYILKPIKVSPRDKAASNDKKKNNSTAPKFIAHQQMVTLGERHGDRVSVLKGLQPAEQVVTSGQLKHSNDMPIIINNSIEPNDPSTHEASHG